MIYCEVYELMDSGSPFPRRYLTTGTIDQMRDTFGTAEGICRIVLEPLPAFINELIDEATGIQDI